MMPALRKKHRIDGQRSGPILNFKDELKEVCNAYQAAVGGIDEPGEESGFGFPKRMATSAEVSRIIWGDRVGHRGMWRGRDRDV